MDMVFTVIITLFIIAALIGIRNWLIDTYTKALSAEMSKAISDELPKIIKVALSEDELIVP